MPERDRWAPTLDLGKTHTSRSIINSGHGGLKYNFTCGDLNVVTQLLSLMLLGLSLIFLRATRLSPSWDMFCCVVSILLKNRPACTKSLPPVRRRPGMLEEDPTGEGTASPPEPSGPSADGGGEWWDPI